MKEISKDYLYEALLGYGLFSDKLPPCFSSHAFYEYCRKKKNNFSSRRTDYISYDNIRNINIPRSLGIPTPMSYNNLCKCPSDHWDKIVNHFEVCTNSQRHKVSRIHVRRMKGRKHIFEMNYPDWKIDENPEPELLIGKKYAVKADISACFPSIYTHAIAWALVGRKEAKANRNNCWYNQLDQKCRYTSCGETNGILIGPHTSNIISEIILCKIDSVLAAKYRYIRNIDDYTAYVESEEEANQFLIDLQRELGKFKLSLNHKKTKILRLLLASTEYWVRKIQSFSLLTSYNKVDYRNCQLYLDFAIETADRENNNAAVLKYAIKVLSNMPLTENARKYEIQSVFHLVLLFPYIVPLLEKYVFEQCGVEKKSIQNLAGKIYTEYMPQRAFEAVSYAIYWCLKYKLTVEEIDVHKILDSDDCILMLLAYKYFVWKKDVKAYLLLKEYAEELAKSNDELERYWLFVYEVCSQDVLSDDWLELKRKGITFCSI